MGMLRCIERKIDQAPAHTLDRNKVQMGGHGLERAGRCGPGPAGRHVEDRIERVPVSRPILIVHDQAAIRPYRLAGTGERDLCSEERVGRIHFLP